MGPVAGYSMPPSDTKFTGQDSMDAGSPIEALDCSVSTILEDVRAIEVSVRTKGRAITGPAP